MSVPAEAAREIQSHVSGAADSLHQLSMQYILHLERGPLGCHPHYPALGEVKLHIPSSLPCLQSVKVHL